MEIENRVERISSFHPMQKFFLLFLMSVFMFSVLLWVLDGFDLKEFFVSRGWFEIESVEMEVQWPLSDKQVDAWLPKLEGESLISVNVDKIAKELESKNWVKEVTIRKKYPDTLAIKVETKIPKAIFIDQGKPFYVDIDGSPIEHISAKVAQKYELPVITMLRQSTLVKWELSEALYLLEKFKSRLAKHYSVSEVFLETYPYFRVFLASPRVEVLFNHKNWDSQVARLMTLLTNPPSQVGQIARINLVFPKKAIVSSSLSN